MGKIIILDENTSNKIAAGEVVERPASVVKELVENSIDAGATSIQVEIKNGGISYIKVSDNGSGIDEDDAEIAFERHATSKIRSSDDLEAIYTLGFRGEALASIAAVSSVELTTRVKQKTYGTYIKIQGGVTREVRQTGCPAGTTFIVRDLFYNTPARYKFLKKDSTEAGYVSDTLSRIVLGNPGISFKLVSSGSSILHTPGNNDLLSAIFSVYGKETAREVLEVKYEDGKFNIQGYAGKPEIARANRNHQSFFINGRYIRSKLISSAVEEAYKTILLKNKYPFAVLDIKINPSLVDINVHPTKLEVRFSDEQEAFRAVYHAVGNALLKREGVRSILLDMPGNESLGASTESIPKIKYTQQRIDAEELLAKEPVPDSLFGKRTEGAVKTYTADTAASPAAGVKKTHTIASVPESTGKASISCDSDTFQPQEACSIEIEEDVQVQDNAETINKESSVTGNEIGFPERENCDRKEKETVHTNAAFLKDADYIGQAFSTYILLQYGDELLLIDQHAAHERIMYEKLKRSYGSGEKTAQMLAAPVVIDLTHQEQKFIDDEKEIFEKLGFIIENFGNNSIILRSVPGSEYKSSAKEAFLDIVDYMMSTYSPGNFEINDEALYTIACKAAVKANKKLEPLEVRELLKEMSLIPNPFTCPHGRPAIIRITKYELEKMFKRVI